MEPEQLSKVGGEQTLSEHDQLPNVGGKQAGSLPSANGVSLGEFLADPSGTRQIDANVGRGGPIFKGAKNKPQQKRIAGKRESLEKAGATPHLEIAPKET